MEKQVAVPAHTGILHSLKGKATWVQAATQNLEAWGPYARWTKAVTKGPTLHASEAVPAIVKFMETESQMGVVEENRDLVSNGDRVSGWDGEWVLEKNGGDGGSALWIHSMPVNCVVKAG